MNLEKHVTSLELARKLKELGVPQDSSFYWVKNDLSGDHLPTLRRFCSETEMELSSFLASELGEMLPKQFAGDNGGTLITAWANAREWQAGYFHFGLRRPADQSEICLADTEPDARAKLLIHLIEQGIISFANYKAA